MEKARSVPRSIAALALGVLCALVALEVFFAVFAGAFRRAAPSPVAVGAGFTVLCLGNSYTKGDAAPAGASYPELLEKIFRERRPDLRARVVNGGVSNATTTTLLERLPAQLRSLRPDVVTLMPGEPNYRFSYGYSRFLAKSARGSWLAAAERVLHSTHVFRWLQLLVRGFQPDGHGSDPGPLYWLSFVESQTYGELVSSEDAKRAFASLDGYFRDHPGDPAVAQALAHLAMYTRSGLPEIQRRVAIMKAIDPARFPLSFYHFARNRLEKCRKPEACALAEAVVRSISDNYPGDARYGELVRFYYFNHALAEPPYPAGLKGKQKCEYLRALLAYHPLDLSRYEPLVSCYSRETRIEDAVDPLIAGALANPYDLTDGALRLLSAVIEKSTDEKVKARVQNFVDDFIQRFPGRASIFGRIGAERVSDWVRSDILEMISLIRTSGARALLETYPPLRNRQLRTIERSRLIPELARSQGIPLADEHAALEKLMTTEIAKESYYSDRFGKQDHHLNERGNQAIAESLYQALESNGMIPRQRAERGR